MDNNNNRELPAVDLLTTQELTLYDYEFDIKDVNGKMVRCSLDKLPYLISQKFTPALLVDVFQKADKRVVDRGIIKSIDKEADITEILTQKEVVKSDTVKSYFVKVVPSYTIMQQTPKWVDTAAFSVREGITAILNFKTAFKYTEGYIKWSLLYADSKEKIKKTIAVGNDSFSVGIAYIERTNRVFKNGSYELDLVNYSLDDISRGQVVVKWELEVDTSILTNSNSIQIITT